MLIKPVSVHSFDLLGKTKVCLTDDKSVQRHPFGTWESKKLRLHQLVHREDFKIEKVKSVGQNALIYSNTSLDNPPF